MEEKITLWERLTTPMPMFFKKIRNFAITIGAIGTALLAVSGLPHWITEASGYMITIGAVATAVSSVTVDTKALRKSRALRSFRK